MASTTLSEGQVVSTELITDSLPVRILKYIGLAILDVFALLLIYGFLFDGNLATAVVVAIITIFANVVIFFPRLYPLRWMAPGLMLSMMLVIYPLIFTVQVAFTNYSTGNLLDKQQAIRQIIRVGGTFVPEDATEYSLRGASIYEAEDGRYALLLSRDLDDGTVETIFAAQDLDVMIVDADPDDPPAEIEGFAIVTERSETVSILNESLNNNYAFGTGDNAVGLANSRTAASPLIRTFVYDEETDTILNQATGEVFVADESIGFFVPESGGGEDDALNPGYRVFIGLENFERLVSDPALSGPLVDIFVWTFAFAFLSVLTTFALGLGVAMVLNDPIVPGRKIIRSILLIPYAIPGVIAIVIWRGMLNQNLGIINDLLDVNVLWLNDAFWSKFSLVFVNLWLGYPYMMLITSGALQSIPSEVYEAASVDGASPWQKFWGITLPLLFVAVGPLLIASFVFNFNNYLLIEALTAGNPPISGSLVPNAGQSDILISYVYKSAFSSEADFGYAAAVTIIIFLIVATITLIQFRFTNTWEEVSENV